VTVYHDYDEAIAALNEHDDEPGKWELVSSCWILREKSEFELRQETKFHEEAVWVTFPTSADLSHDMGDKEWIGLGKMVAEVAADIRAAQS
jgi:hypothetical protein